ncbi:hypothetical protein J6590_024013 [Homalodisca vitripennis]|nr:hypothetical protein J6590_024013 [Homalodisca vitripennis]
MTSDLRRLLWEVGASHSLKQLLSVGVKTSIEDGSCQPRISAFRWALPGIKRNLWREGSSKSVGTKLVPCGIPGAQTLRDCSRFEPAAHSRIYISTNSCFWTIRSYDPLRSTRPRTLIKSARASTKPAADCASLLSLSAETTEYHKVLSSEYGGHQNFPQNGLHLLSFLAHIYTYIIRFYLAKRTQFTRRRVKIGCRLPLPDRVAKFGQGPAHTSPKVVSEQSYTIHHVYVEVTTQLNDETRTNSSVHPLDGCLRCNVVRCGRPKQKHPSSGWMDVWCEAVFNQYPARPLLISSNRIRGRRPQRVIGKNRSTKTVDLVSTVSINRLLLVLLHRLMDIVSALLLRDHRFKSQGGPIMYRHDN